MVKTFTLAFLITFFSFGFSEVPERSLSDINDNIEFVTLKSEATSFYLTIIPKNPKQVLKVKIMDTSGFLRMTEELHTDKTIDVSTLKEGLYLLKISTKDYVTIKRFYKGNDGLDLK